MPDGSAFARASFDRSFLAAGGRPGSLNGGGGGGGGYGRGSGLVGGRDGGGYRLTAN
ncbi:MAG: hypothetical protein ACK5RL_20270 [Acidimicrobiales bacterium]